MPVVSAREHFDELIASGTSPLGTFIVSTDPSTSAIMGSVGFDFVVVDSEHGCLNVETVAHHIRAAQATGAIGLVRVSDNSPVQIQQALDLGAQGVIVPKVASGEAAEQAVAASQYATGGRGACPGCSAADWNPMTWRSHVASSNANVLVIPLIETREGVDNARDIGAVEGIDYLIFGPADFAQDVGIDYVDDNAQLVGAWNRLAADVHGVGVRAGAPLGFGFEGADFGFHGSDLMTMRVAAAKELEHWRNEEHWAVNRMAARAKALS